jgi:hypothetical protein
MMHSILTLPSFAAYLKRDAAEASPILLTEGKPMTREELVDLAGKILNTDVDLSFLLELSERDLQTLIACIRHRIEQEKQIVPSSVH